MAASGILVRYEDTSMQCWSRVDTANGDNIYISVSRTGVTIKKSNLGLLGDILFSSNDLDTVAKIAVNLTAAYIPSVRPCLLGETDEALEDVLQRNKPVPPRMNNPVLIGFTSQALFSRSAEAVRQFLGMEQILWDTSKWIAALRRIDSGYSP